ncbi:aspartic peptidase domain-containing protein [Linnemannia elongata]|nr:aspartic peptidase domain-containing protein [Linnemannia elongata]
MVSGTTHLVAVIALLHTATTFCLATNLGETVLSTYQSVKDLSHSDLTFRPPILHFKLDRRELAPSHLEARSIHKPYTIGESASPPIAQFESGSLASPSCPSDQLLSPSSYTTSSSSSTVLPSLGAISAMSCVELTIPMTGIPKEYGYTAIVSIGTYKAKDTADTHPSDQQLFNLLVDTGSDLVAVTSASCTDPECLQIRHRYNPALSSTAAPTKNHLTNSPRWAQIYGDGTVANGTLVQDTLRFMSSSSSTSFGEPLEVVDQPILVIDQPGLHLFKSYGYGVDGILGMNLQSLVVSQTVIQNLQRLEAEEIKRGGIESQIGYMGLWLGKSMEAGQGGELIFNGIDDSKFQGPIHWSDRGSSPFDWSIPLDRGILLVDSSPSGSAANSAITPAKTTATMPTKLPYTLPMTEYTFAVLDSGSDGIYLQRSTYDALFSRIPEAKKLKTGYWRVPCEGRQELWVCIQGQVYRIPYHDWVKKPTAAGNTPEVVAEIGPGMCQTKVFGSSPGPTLLGATFLRTVYTVFDFRRPGYERIGLARLTSVPSSST